MISPNTGNQTNKQSQIKKIRSEMVWANGGILVGPMTAREPKLYQYTRPFPLDTAAIAACLQVSLLQVGNFKNDNGDTQRLRNLSPHPRRLNIISLHLHTSRIGTTRRSRRALTSIEPDTFNRSKINRSPKPNASTRTQKQYSPESNLAPKSERKKQNLITAKLQHPNPICPKSVCFRKRTGPCNAKKFALS